MQADVVTWQDAEDAMTEAVETLFALPDVERGFLSAGSRSAWPQVIRSVRDGDYGEGQHFGEEATPSPRTTRRMVARMEAVLTGERAAALAIPEGHRRLVGRVIVMQRWPGPDAFGWSRVWQAERGHLFHLRYGKLLPATSEAMRKAYERAIGKVAIRMTRLSLCVEMMG